MGGRSSRRQNIRTPIPPYTPAVGGATGISRPGIGNAPINRDQQRELMNANQQIANLTNQLQNAQMGGGMGGAPMLYNSPMYGQPPSPYLPRNTPFPNSGGLPPLPYQQQQMSPLPAYRDTDFAAIANIAGLNSADIALLHREFLNLTRGGTNKIDRNVFRLLLRDILLEANSEHVDRALENMFVTIDRNRDGFIDFPEFVGAFKDVLKGHISDQPGSFGNGLYPDILTEQLIASGVGSGIAAQPIQYIQQAQPVTQVVPTGGLNIVPLASTAMQQAPIFYGNSAPLQFTDASAPLLSFDSSQASYVIATPGQYLITQPTALQCVPLPMM